MNSLDPRIRVIWVLRAIVVAAVVGAVGVGVSTLADISRLVPVGLAVVLVVGGVIHAILRYRNWAYVVHEAAI